MTRRTIRWVVAIMAIGTLIAGGLGVLKGTAIAEQPAAPLGTARVAASRIDAGDLHTCAVLEDASVRCWGNGAVGQLGYGNTDTIGDDETPARDPSTSAPGAPPPRSAAGGDHTCAALDDGSVRCWGFGFGGQLGYGNTDTIGDDETPGSAGPVDLGAGRTATAITAGADHTCAILDDASVRCWGSGLGGQLGYGNTDTHRRRRDPGRGRRCRPRRRAHRHRHHRRRQPHLRDPRRRQRALLGLPAVPGGSATATPTTIGDDETPGTVGPGRPRRRAHRHRDRRRCQPHLRDPRRRQRALLGGRVRRPARVRQHRHDRRRRDPRHGRARSTWVPGAPPPRSTTGADHTCADTRRRHGALLGQRRSAGSSATATPTRSATTRRRAPSAPSTSAPAARPPRSPAAASTPAPCSTTAPCAAGATAPSGRLGYGNNDDIGDDETPASAGPVALVAGSPPPLARGALGPP